MAAMSSILTQATSTSATSLLSLRKASRPCSRSSCRFPVAWNPPQATRWTHHPVARLEVVVVRAAQNDEGGKSSGSPSGSFSLPTIPDWSKWLVGSVMWLSMPTWKKLKDIGDRLKNLDQMVEKVENYAAEADKFTTGLAKELPDGKLKEVVMGFDKASEELASRAKLLDEFIDRITGNIDEILSSMRKGKEKEKEKEKERADQAKTTDEEQDANEGNDR